MSMCCVLLIGTVNRCAADAMADRADQVFLQQLTERGFFQLAEQHCRAMISAAATSQQRAGWHLRLSDTNQKRAWAVPGAGRISILNQTVDDLTDYLNTNAPPPESNLQIRLRIARAMSQSVRMALVISEAGHTFRRVGKANNVSPLPEAKHHKATLERGTAMLDGLLKHLEQTRKEIDPDEARVIREQGRLALGEIHVLQWRLNQHAHEASALQEQATQLLTQCQRSSKDSQLKHRASWLLAELSLYAGDSEDFQIQIRSLYNTYTPTPFGLPEFLSIRDFLFRQEATAALKLAKSTTPRTSLQREQLEWLKLEAILGLRDLADQLADEELAERVTQEFSTQRIRSSKLCRGLFRDACENTIRRFELVNEVGSDVADMIERIEYERSQQQNDTALRLIDLSLARLSPVGTERSRGALELRAGEILLDLKHWSRAIDRLQRASELLAVADMKREEAAADLLRIFAMAQLIGMPGKDYEIDNEAYIAALENHLSKYSEEATSARAREWLQKIVAADDPGRAAALILERISTQQNAAEKAKLFQQAGSLLRNAPTENKELSETRKEFLRQLEDNIKTQNTFDAADRALLRLIRLYFEILKHGNDNDWKEHETSLAEIRRGLVNSSHAASADIQIQINILNIVIQARVRTDANTLDSLKRPLMNLNQVDRQAAISFLDTQISSNQLHHGDDKLADVIVDLIEVDLERHADEMNASTIAQKISAASRAASRCQRTDALDRLLQLVSNVEFTDKQLAQVVEAMSRLEISNDEGTGTSVQQTFWRSLISSRPQGSEIWLEASLQSAKLLAASGHQQQAKKQLGVITTIYPDWGNEARKQRADNLIRSLTEKD